MPATREDLREMRVEPGRAYEDGEREAPTPVAESIYRLQLTVIEARTGRRSAASWSGLIAALAIPIPRRISVDQLMIWPQPARVRAADTISSTRVDLGNAVASRYRW